ncbi:MAG: hypothetical protein ACLPY2_09915 [Bryobacteraceae bacterium]|jgi:hypothetical protein
MTGPNTFSTNRKGGRADWHNIPKCRPTRPRQPIPADSFAGSGFDQIGKGKNEINDLFDDLIEHKIAVHFGIEPRGWSFQNHRSVVQLQASDILAWEAHKYIKENQPPRALARNSFVSLTDKVDINTRFFDGTRLPDFVADATSSYEATNWSGPLGGFFANP